MNCRKGLSEGIRAALLSAVLAQIELKNAFLWANSFWNNDIATF